MLNNFAPLYVKPTYLFQLMFLWNFEIFVCNISQRIFLFTNVCLFLSEIINRLVDDLKDENEQYRKMVMESIEKIMGGLGAADIDSRLEEQLIDGILYAFQEQVHKH